MIDFKPTMLGFVFYFEDDDAPAMITDETEEEFYVESDHYTGWWNKAAFWETWGVPD